MLEFIEINPKQGETAAVIWLHGLGANGHDFEPIVPELALPENHGIRFIFPHAPERPVTINNGYVMPAWFDIAALDRLDGADEQGILLSVEQILELVEQQHKLGVPYENIIVAGFSQGGVIALHTAGRTAKPLGGVIALSTYLPLQEQLVNTIPSSHQKTPVFMAHGAYDPVIPITLGRISYNAVDKLFEDSQWHEYSMEHSVCLEEIGMIGSWLLQRPFMQS